MHGEGVDSSLLRMVCQNIDTGLKNFEHKWLLWPLAMHGWKLPLPMVRNGYPRSLTLA
jgi:hypothetical protein